MSIRLGTIGAASLGFVFCLAAEFDGSALGQEKAKGKDSIQTLFEGLPADLRTKVKANPVRCDRVNDWLKEHVNGKGKTIEMKVDVKRVRPYRAADGTYSVNLELSFGVMNLLGNDWKINVGDRKKRPGEYAINFFFDGVSAADAEKLADAKQVVLEGKLQEITLPRLTSVTPEWGAMILVLEDVHVDGKKWKKGSKRNVGKFGSGEQ